MGVEVVRGCWILELQTVGILLQAGPLCLASLDFELVLEELSYQPVLD